MIAGEPGVGKTALLEAVRAQADDMRVLSGSGVESEAQLPFAALEQIVRPVLNHVGQLPAVQAAALRGALGLAEEASADRFLVSLAVLSLLADVAEHEPVVCLVDDAHWLDDASADALVFVARRLEAEGVVMLFAARESETRRFEAPGLPLMTLEGLDAIAAEELISRRARGPLSPEVRDRLIAETGGNPLALVELSPVLTEEQLVGAEAVLAPIPVSDRVSEAFLARVHGLPDPSQTLLLVAAADDTGQLANVLGASARLDVPAAALDAVEQAGLAQAGGDRLELRHPLLRSAVYQDAPLSRRRAAHLALADVLEGDDEADRRAWHRAAASVEPDPSVGTELEHAAQRARRRAGFAAASLAFERAAALTTDEADRVRRMTAAAQNAWLAGRVERSLSLVESVRPLVSEPLPRADVERLLGLIEMTRGVPADACRLLLRAATDVAPSDYERALELLNLAGIAAAYAGDLEAPVEIARVARGLAGEQTPLMRVLAQLLIGLGAHAEGDYADALTNLRAALEGAEALHDDSGGEEPVALLFAGRAALYLGDERAAYRAHREAAARARASGALSIVAQILPRLATAEVWAGRWSAGEVTAREGLELARQIGQHDLVAFQLAVLAVVAGLRGSEDECRSLAAESRELASARGLSFAEFAHWALAVLELSLGQADDALRHCREISVSVTTFWGGLDRIEAAIRAGDRETGQTWLEDVEAWAESDGVDWGRAVALHGRALLAEESDAERLFREALEAHAGSERPFERARTELAFGELLRRARRRVEAREHLRAALDGFEALGAGLWAERARVELRASGQAARKRNPSTRGQLTAQELQIARFVAEGLTNREVAAQLFLSPRTIGFHLRNVYRKLGITSRTALARLDLES